MHFLEKSHKNQQSLEALVFVLSLCVEHGCSHSHWRILLFLLFSFESVLVGIYRTYFLEQKVVGWDMINGCGLYLVSLQYCTMQMVALAVHTRIFQTDATGKLGFNEQSEVISWFALLVGCSGGALARCTSHINHVLP